MSITIDGQAIEFAPGATVLETALANGIDIPRLCYHPDLQPSGGCRLCTVEVEGRGHARGQLRTGLLRRAWSFTLRASN